MSGLTGPAGGALAQRQVALADQPLVHADAAEHRLGAVVGDHHQRGVLPQPLDQRADLGVEVAVVVAERLLVGRAGHVVGVAVVVVAPEPVVQAVGAHLDHHEEVPGARVAQVPGQLEPALRHLIDVAQDPVLLVGAEVGHVHHVLADDLLDLVAQLLGVGVLRVGRRRQKAADHLAVHPARRKRLGNAQHHHVLADARQDVPDAVFLHLLGGGEGEPVVGVVLAVAEAVEAERARDPWSWSCTTRPAR